METKQTGTIARNLKALGGEPSLHMIRHKKDYKKKVNSGSIQVESFASQKVYKWRKLNCYC